ncbi:hypothetical protein [Streptomyces sp. NPDC006463]|uniref:hypothetical protein n=1 Tax=Streptomyces sp. NPDC006463 TaxID=3364746 RepID=UPI0036992413
MSSGSAVDALCSSRSFEAFLAMQIRPESPRLPNSGRGRPSLCNCVLLALRMRRRWGLRLRDTRPGLVALAGVWGNVPAILVELFMLWAVRTPDGSGSVLGDCG